MKLGFCILILFVSSFSHGQDFFINNNYLIQRIYSEKSNLILQNQIRVRQIIPLEKNFENYRQHLIRNNKGSFVIVDGTGRIYNAEMKSNDTVYYQRIDSTHFYGYNGEAINFTYKDTIFSFGGNGYWRANGQLRYFNEKYHEWNIIPLNEEIPTLNTLYYFDSVNADLYFLQVPLTNYATNQTTEGFNIYKLDILNRSISKLGSVKNEFFKLFPEKYEAITITTNSLNGVIADFGKGNQLLIDLKNNKCFSLKSLSIKNIFSGSSTNNLISYAFELNNWLYYTRSNDPTMQLDSVKITMDDFIPSDTPFYVPESNNQNLLAGIGLGILILSGAFIYFYRRKKFIQAENTNEEIDIDGFKSIELDLIEKIYKKTAEGKSYSVEDINTALGLSKKSLEIQKKIRTETINRINHRFKIKYNTEEDLIERVRLEEDRRFYKYIINEENGKKALGI